MHFFLLLFWEERYSFFKFIKIGDLVLYPNNVKNWFFACVLLLPMFLLTGCYQVHSDDDLRTVPVTNNPNIVPNQGMRLPSAPM